MVNWVFACPETVFNGGAVSLRRYYPEQVVGYNLSHSLSEKHPGCGGYLI
jgi:hypothetical protein